MAEKPSPVAAEQDPIDTFQAGVLWIDLNGGQGGAKVEGLPFHPGHGFGKGDAGDPGKVAKSSVADADDGRAIEGLGDRQFDLGPGVAGDDGPASVHRIAELRLGGGGGEAKRERAQQ